MNHDDFGQWLEKHVLLFPDVRTWLNKFGEKMKLEIQDRWQEIFLNIDYLDAVKASEKLYGSESRPRTYADHPRWIMNFARKEQISREEQQAFARFGQQTYKCNQCSDTGWVEIYSVGSLLVHGIEQYGRDQALYFTQCVHCDCDFGKSLGRPFIDRTYMIQTKYNKKWMEKNRLDIWSQRIMQVESAAIVVEREMVY